ncbi:cytochrome b/b6 domain-containing protein [Ancylobacter sp. 6x-1]|uniref:Cytochrome b/b6 domain-containing protein n=1 Tax=Ancylobacter crimeensis TaxID=2579147 RepID=A0ABT0DA78_9HYPH|nr:cytochrome b/b6 domain-containing protein [Ancylobacter crimeensis]MCK0196861.1 cytochrome b/b6 domain-containing protein [Ancylobacter crimeensis]
MSLSGTTGAAAGTAEKTAPALLAWDLPTRLAKWLLAILVGLAFASRYYGDANLVWHMWNGLAILVVLVFRLLWGLVGGSTARFSTFLYGPGTVIGYLAGLMRGRPRHYLGHNPAGGWMVVALLGAVAAQALTGLFTTDDIMIDGPMVRVASEHFVSRASALHARIYLVLLALIGLHVAANLLYSAFGRDNLIGAMLSGRKKAGHYVDAERATPGSVLRALACLVLAVGIVFGGVALAGGRPFP